MVGSGAGLAAARGRELDCDADRAELSEVVVLDTGQGRGPVARFERCAVVGSSSSLRGRALGAEIDGHDTVIRVNRLPVERHYSDLGRKTDIYFADPIGYSPDGYKTQYVGGAHEMCNFQAGGHGCDFGALILKGADWVETCRPWFERFYDKQHARRPRDAAFPIGHQSDMVNTVAYQFLALQGFRPSSGLQALVTFAPVCRSVVLYGFGGRETFDGHNITTYHVLRFEHAVIDNLAGGTFARKDWPDEWAALWPWVDLHLAARGRRGCIRRVKG